MPLSVEEVIALFERRGAEMYGSEAVNQRDHALQCAALAAENGASATLIAACLLHDLGHLVAERPHEIGESADDVHQYLAIPFLRGTFPETVLQPIRLHVDAKRYLCEADTGYLDRLSPASRHSLQLQGGVFNRAQSERFTSNPHALDAVRLRRWDDEAKVPGRPTPSLPEFAVILRAVARGTEKAAA